MQSSAKRRDRKREVKPALPSFIMGNVESLINKMDLLEALTRTNLEFWQCSLICFTKCDCRNVFQTPAPLRRYKSYKSVVESTVSSVVICWGSSIRASDLKKLNKLIKKAGSVLGTVLEILELILQQRILHKMKNIMDNSEYPLHSTVFQQQIVFSQSFLQICCNMDRYRRFFLHSYNGVQ